MVYQILVIGDSHLKPHRVNYQGFPPNVRIFARGGLHAAQVDETIFHQQYDAFVLIIGGNDIGFHEKLNPEPASPEATAQYLLSWQSTLILSTKY